MSLQTVLEYLAAYGAYALGASIYLIDLLAKYNLMAQSNPDPNVNLHRPTFWRKEKLNIIKIALLGVVALILIAAPMQGMSMDFVNSAGDLMFTLDAKVAMIPVFLVLGWGGGRGVIALGGKYKESFYKKVGISDDKADI